MSTTLYPYYDCDLLFIFLVLFNALSPNLTSLNTTLILHKMHHIMAILNLCFHYVFLFNRILEYKLLIFMMSLLWFYVNFQVYLPLILPLPLFMSVHLPARIPSFILLLDSSPINILLFQAENSLPTLTWCFFRSIQLQVISLVHFASTSFYLSGSLD